MSKRKPGASAVPKISLADVRFQKWVSRAYGFAAFCLAALALLEATKTATPLLRTLLMLGIAAAGTAAWVLQARRTCPKCGQPYGFGIRIVHANKCRYCGAEFPSWRPGMDEAESKGE